MQTENRVKKLFHLDTFAQAVTRKATTLNDLITSNLPFIAYIKLPFKLRTSGQLRASELEKKGFCFTALRFVCLLQTYNSLETGT